MPQIVVTEKKASLHHFTLKQVFDASNTQCYKENGSSPSLQISLMSVGIVLRLDYLSKLFLAS